MLEAIDLKALVQDLQQTGKIIHIAYCGAAAELQYSENQIDNMIQLQRLGYDITKLCDKSALTVMIFKDASSTILTDLQSTYTSISLRIWRRWLFTHSLVFCILQI